MHGDHIIMHFFFEYYLLFVNQGGNLKLFTVEDR